MTDAKRDAPPYLSFKTFHTFLQSTRAGVPGCVDRSVLRHMSGAQVSQLLVALRFFRLVDQAGHPQPRLEALAAAPDDQQPKILLEYIKDSYTFLFDGSINLQNMTQKQLTSAFEKVASGDTIRKAVAFFIRAAKFAGLTISPYVKAERIKNGVRRKVRAVDVGRTADIADDDDDDEEEPTAGKATSWHKLLLDKFPEFDPSWPDEVKAKWFESFGELMKKGEPSD